MSYQIVKHIEFESAHRLPWHQGKCQFLHGHSYKLEVCIESEALKPEGIVEDFGTLKQAINQEIIETHDHKFLNELYENPTAELMTKAFFILLETYWKEHKLNGWIKWVRLYETSNSYAEYSKS
jgi:6-pyruvoyltetrahydropterin/6-carboxytetrahydropterin synthase